MCIYHHLRINFKDFYFIRITSVWLLSLFLLLLCKNTGYGQTCVIAKITSLGKDTSITIGADTKFSNYVMNYGNDDIDTTYTKGHKIFNIGKITYVITGFGAVIQRRVADSILHIKDRLTLRKMTEMYGSEFQRLLMREMARIKKRAPKMYNRLVIDNQSIISSTIFAGFEFGKPYLVQLLFTITRQGIINCVVNNGPLLAGGELDAIQEDLNTEKTWANGPLPAIRSMLKKEAKARADKVGPPFDFCVIKKNKIQLFSEKQ